MTFRRLLKTVILVYCLLLFNLKPVIAETLFGVTFGPTNLSSKLISINTSSGKGTLVGTLQDSIPSDIASNGKALFIFDQAHNLLKQIDPSTASTLKTLNIGVTILGEGGMSFRNDGVGFICEGSLGNFYSFNTETSTSILIGRIYSSDIDGIAFDQNNVLYGLSSSLYEIDQTNGLVTYMGDTGITKTLGLGGLAFRSDGVLFGVIDDKLYTINKMTGAAKLIGPIGFSDVSGIAFHETEESLVVNDQTLQGAEERWVRFVGESIVSMLLGTREEQLQVASEASWWGLKEGTFSLSNPYKHSVCNQVIKGVEKDISLKPLEICPAGRAWQVGLAAVQVPNFSESEVETLVSLLWPSRGITDLLAEIVEQAGFDPEKGDGYKIVHSEGVLRKSWLMRHPAVGLSLVEQDVNRECINDAQSWCFGTGWKQTAKYAATYEDALQSIDDLEEIFIFLAP